MVFLDDRIEDCGEIFVAVPVTSIDTTMLVVKRGGTSDALSQIDAGGSGPVVTKLVPYFFSDVLCHQGVGRLDFRESGHPEGIFWLEILELVELSIWC